MTPHEIDMQQGATAVPFTGQEGGTPARGVPERAEAAREAAERGAAACGVPERSETEALTFEHAHAMPAITWHSLHMNDTQIAIPAGLAVAPELVTDAGADADAGASAAGTAGAPAASTAAAAAAAAPRDAFSRALAHAQVAWEHTHPAPTAEECRVQAEVMAAEADATYGGTARSSYQVQADELEEARNLARTFEAGTSADVVAHLHALAGEPTVLCAAENETLNVNLALAARRDVANVATIDVVAEAGSVVNVSLLVECTEGLLPCGCKQPSCRGLTATMLRVFAGAGARVSVVRTQALCDGITDIDEMNIFADARAQVYVRQTVLGAAESYVGFGADLRGDAAQIDIDTRYLGQAEQQRDFNYIVRHHGQKTTSSMAANGVLANASSKTLRGTIDFIRGCCGSEGSESDTVLLVDEGVRNKTVPTLLCNEDDVMGNHGATIGHIRDEQLFYLMSRGLSPEQAERMFVAAMMEQAVLDAPNSATKEAVVRLGTALTSDFADRFE